MEAASASKPSVASNTPCVPDLVKDGVSGYLCEIDNVNKFTEAAEKLVKSRNLRERFGKAAFKHIQNFDWGVIIKKYERFYRSLVKSE